MHFSKPILLSLTTLTAATPLFLTTPNDVITAIENMFKKIADECPATAWGHCDADKEGICHVTHSDFDYKEELESACVCVNEGCTKDGKRRCNAPDCEFPEDYFG